MFFFTHVFFIILGSCIRSVEADNWPIKRHQRYDPKTTRSRLYSSWSGKIDLPKILLKVFIDPSLYAADSGKWFFTIYLRLHLLISLSLSSNRSSKNQPIWLNKSWTSISLIRWSGKHTTKRIRYNKILLFYKHLIQVSML